MAIDIRTETIIDVRQQAANYLGLGRGGKPPHHSFFIRAITKGVKGHKLEALRVGSRWITSVEALQRWAERQTVAAGVTDQTSTVSRRKDIARTERELDRLGF